MNGAQPDHYVVPEHLEVFKSSYMYAFLKAGRKAKCGICYQ